MLDRLLAGVTVFVHFAFVIFVALGSRVFPHPQDRDSAVPRKGVH